MDRFVCNIPGTTFKTFDVDETATAATGQPTVTVTNAIGTTLATAEATTGSSPYGYAISGFTAPDLLTLAWSATVSGSARVESTQAEIVGGRYFELRELRSTETTIQSTSDYSTARLVVARDRAEQRMEQCMGRSFTSRVAVERFQAGRGPEVRLLWPHVQSVRQVKVGSTVLEEESGYELVQGAGSARLYLIGWWDPDTTVEVVYVHGAAVVPDDVRFAAMKLAAFYTQRSGVPDRAMGRAIDADGSQYTIATPGPGRVGIPEVDAIIADRRLVTFG